MIPRARLARRNVGFVIGKAPFFTILTQFRSENSSLLGCRRTFTLLRIPAYPIHEGSCRASRSGRICCLRNVGREMAITT
jgi:hypothetical protein